MQNTPKHKVIFNIYLIVILLTVVLNSCIQTNTGQETNDIYITEALDTTSLKNIPSPFLKTEKTVKNISDFEQLLIKYGLVNLKDIDSSIQVDLKYSSTDNFLGTDLYEDLEDAYLQKAVALKVAHAQKLLKDTLPSHSLIVYDAVRPRSIQQKMWETIKVPNKLRSKYLSNPKYGSLHNFGVAVDVSIIDGNQKELDMGTNFDSFKEKAYPVLEEQMLKKGLLTEQQVDNRKLLRSIMKEAGFTGIQTEWWHFNACTRKVARQKFAMIESLQLPKTETLLAINDNQKTDDKFIYITFKVQIKTSTKPIKLNSKLFKGVDINKYYHKGMYKYTTGEFKELASAHKLRSKMRKLGFHDCFIAGFNNNKRVGIKDAIELLQ